MSNCSQLIRSVHNSVQKRVSSIWSNTFKLKLKVAWYPKFSDTAYRISFINSLVMNIRKSMDMSLFHRWNSSVTYEISIEGLSKLMRKILVEVRMRNEFLWSKCHFIQICYDFTEVGIHKRKYFWMSKRQTQTICIGCSICTIFKR